MLRELWALKGLSDTFRQDIARVRRENPNGNGSGFLLDCSNVQDAFCISFPETPKLRADFLSILQKAKFGLISRLSKDEEWGRRDLNPDRRVSPTRGATHACCANHGSALQSVITGISKPVSPSSP